MDSKNHYSDLYYKLRNQIETTWPQWKIDAANDFIVGKNSSFLTKRDKMTCYRKGGCGPYENRSCYECPASKPEYALTPAQNQKPLKIILEEPRLEIIPCEDNNIEIKYHVSLEELCRIIEEVCGG